MLMAVEKQEAAPRSPRRKIGDVRADLVACATRLFADRGFDGVTTRDICEAARVPMSGVYRHFRDKRALYEHCTFVAYETVSAGIWATLEEPMPPERFVYRYALGLCDLYFGHADVPKLVLRSMLEEDQDLLRRLTAEIVFDRVQRIIGRLEEMGQGARAQLIVHGLHSMSFGYANMAVMIGNLDFDLPELERGRTLAVAILALLVPAIDWAAVEREDAEVIAVAM